MGRPKGSKNKPKVLTPEVEAFIEQKKRTATKPDMSKRGNNNFQPGDNARYLRNALVSLDLPPIDITDPVQIDNRIREYFNWCMENDEKPKVGGMANWIGVPRVRIGEWMNNSSGSARSTILKRYYSLLEELWEQYMLEGTINTVSGIFLGKVMFGYRETSEVVVTPNNPMGDIIDAAQIAEKYKELPES